jgi:hypothetical protein
MSRLLTHLVPLCGALTVALMPRLASAQTQECDAANPCPTGFECITGSDDRACPAVDCAEGEECLQPECTGGYTYAYCAPKACDPNGAADQCGDDMVCFSYESGSCSSGGAAPCAEGADCPMVDPVEPECTTTVESYCTFKYVPPCEEAIDCGEGFECVQYEIMSCPGSAGGDTPVSGTGGASSGGDMAGAPAPAQDAGASDPVPPELEAPVDNGCTTELSAEKYCKAIEVTCETDAECLDGWTCVDVGGTAVGGCAITDPADPPPTNGTEPSAGGSAAMAEVDGGAAKVPPVETCVVPEPMPMPKMCTPPGYQYGYGGGVAGSDNDGSATGGMGDENSGGIPDLDLPNENGVGTTGEGDPSVSASGGDQNTDSGGGCSLAAPLGSAPVQGGAALIGLVLGLVSLGLRRKR